MQARTILSFLRNKHIISVTVNYRQVQDVLFTAPRLHTSLLEGPSKNCPRGALGHFYQRSLFTSQQPPVRTHPSLADTTTSPFPESNETLSHMYINWNCTFRSPRPSIKIPTNASFHEIIFSRCDKYKNNIAMEDFLTKQSFTYQELKDKAVKAAGALHSRGLRKGDVILAFNKNHIHFPVLTLAASCLGLRFSTAAHNFSPAELGRQLWHNKAVAVFASPDCTSVVDAALQNKDFPNKVKHRFVFGESPNYEPFHTLLDTGSPSNVPDIHIDPEKDVLLMPYTTGTIGLPKGVSLTHYNCVAMMMQMHDRTRLKPTGRLLGQHPQVHINGQICTSFGAMYAGARVVNLPEYKGLPFLKCLQEKKISHLFLVPAVVQFLAHQSIVSDFDLSSLKQIIVLSSPLKQRVLNDFQSRHPHVQTGIGYGLTETTSTTNLHLNDIDGSAGYLLANTKGKFIDTETMENLGPGKIGEYCIKGPQVMQGYFRNYQATVRVLRPDGWFHTGDLGYYTKDGLVYIKDRMEDVINFDNTRFYPSDMEAILAQHPNVLDVAVIGVPNEQFGEVPKAFIIKKAGSSLDEAKILSFIDDFHCSPSLASMYGLPPQRGSHSYKAYWVECSLFM